MIPFFNEEDTIEQIISRTRPFVDIVIAVNDCSTDGSVQKIPQNISIKILSNKINLGKGAALNKGLEESIKLGYKYAVTLDSDLQHDPKFIPEFMEKIKNADIIIGNRLTNTSAMPFHRIISNKMTSFLLSKKTGQNILDSQCGYRLFRIKILKEILPDSSGFEAETEILIKAARKGYKISFVPISTIYNRKKSHMKSWKTIAGFIKLMLS